MSCLILEDDPLTGPMIVSLLEANGWKARWATCTHDAEIRLQAFDPDLLIVDLSVACQGSRHKTIEEFINTFGSNRRVLVISGADYDHLLRVKERCPNVEVMQKPIEPVELLRVVGRGRKGTITIPNTVPPPIPQVLPPEEKCYPNEPKEDKAKEKSS